jgi:hypothetical protein
MRAKAKRAVVNARKLEGFDGNQQEMTVLRSS